VFCLQISYLSSSFSFLFFIFSSGFRGKEDIFWTKEKQKEPFFASGIIVPSLVLLLGKFGRKIQSLLAYLARAWLSLLLKLK
jgi:hypothetical protein